jgi:Transcription elongation factor, GreA/GreB, C-term
MNMPPWLDDEDEASDKSPRVTVGSRVEIEMIDESGNSEQMTLVIVPDKQADFSSGFLGTSTPLARALVGQQAGSVMPYRQGDIREVQILSLDEGQAPVSNAAAARQAVIQKALERSDLEDAVRLALAVNVKWGEYDPEALTRGEERSDEE